MFWLALASQLSLPIPANARIPDVRAVFSYEDFPAYLVAEGVSRTVYTRTTVRADGSTQGCAAEISSGDPKLDAYTCGIIIRRTRFSPAKWTDGTPVYGVIRLPVRWTVGNGPPSDEELLKDSAADVELSVDHLPKGAHSIASVTLQVGADEDGRPVRCAEYPPLDTKRNPRFSELVPIACQEVMSSLSLTPPVDQSSKKVRSVQSVSVDFKLSH